MIIPKIILPFPLQLGFSTIKDCHLPFTPISLIQTHSNIIIKASRQLKLEADAHWTQENNMPIGVQVADCVPILLAGLINNRPWIAAIHAGWKGITTQILINSINVFINMGGNPKKLLWILGPAILKCHFEVSEEVIKIASKDPVWQDNLITTSNNNSKFYLDLHGLLIAQALSADLALTNKISINLCTYCSSTLFNSYRRNKHCQRQLGWIKII